MKPTPETDFKSMTVADGLRLNALYGIDETAVETAIDGDGQSVSMGLPNSRTGTAQPVDVTCHIYGHGERIV